MSFVLPANFRQLSTSWEIGQPFNVDAAHAIDFSDDPVEWAKYHILALLLTNPGERVMRPNYGIGIYRLVFENDNPVLESQIISAINAGLALWEPNITVNDCEFVKQPDYSGVMELQIAFSVGASPSVYTVGFALNGTAVEITA